MLDQTLFWIQIAGTFIEFLLLGRMLILKLQRVYLFLTLYAAVTLLVDTSSLILGPQSDADVRLFFYSRFLIALTYPLAAWDVFEEAKAQLSKLRRVHLPRLLTGMFLTVVMGFAVSITIEDQDVKGTSSAMDFVGLFVWLGAASTSLLFTWNVFRAARSSDMVLPKNTSVFSLFFLITFVRAVIDCGFVVAISGGLIPRAAVQVIDLILTLFDFCLVAWCTIMIKPLPPGAASAPEKASL